MDCPVCQYVVDFLKKELDDPVTEEEIREKAQQACGLMPTDSLAGSCLAMVQQYGERGARQRKGGGGGDRA